MAKTSGKNSKVTEKIMDMQTLVEHFQKKGKIFKKINPILPKELGIRNKIQIYKAVDLNGFFWAFFIVSQKTRIISKDVAKFEEIYKKLVLYTEHNFKYKTILIDAPLCSKAKKAFKDAGWKVDVTM
jgi:hypothetical protein